MEENNYLILIADDNKENLKMLGNIIKEEKWELAMAINGQQVLEFVEKKLPDIILLDVMMPELDGFETCVKLKEKQFARDIPVVFITAKNDAESIVKGFEIGGVDYIQKPFLKAELVSRVRTHLDLKYQRDLVFQKNAWANELVHVLCHDLANPLGNIVNCMDLLKDNKGDDEISGRMLDIASSSAHSALELIDLVREYQAIEAKSLECHSVNLLKSFDEAEGTLLPLLQKKKLAMKKDISSEININAEKITLVYSVFSNLLTNAIKFSIFGSSIAVSAKQEKKGVLFSIEDYGIGMSEELVSDLFDISQKTSRPGTANEKGTGFGMHLIKKCVEAYGAGLLIESKDIGEYPDEHGTKISIFFKRA